MLITITQLELSMYQSEFSGRGHELVILQNEWDTANPCSQHATKLSGYLCFAKTDGTLLIYRYCAATMLKTMRIIS